MKERIANLVFLRNRLRARRDALLQEPAAADLEVKLALVESNLDDLRRQRLNDAIALARRTA